MRTREKFFLLVDGGALVLSRLSSLLRKCRTARVKFGFLARICAKLDAVRHLSCFGDHNTRGTYGAQRM